MKRSQIVRVEWGFQEGYRPRVAGCNARLGVHGNKAGAALARLTTDEGAVGFGPCYASREVLEGLLGTSVSELWTPEEGVATAWRAVDFPIWDLIGRLQGVPVYTLFSSFASLSAPAASAPLRVPCYDTSLYIDDLHLGSDEEAAALLAAEAREGYERGHRAFKIKVGRGARHMPLAEGTLRDIAVIRAVREAVGPGCPLLLDANNGYNLNLTKQVLAETADCGIYWMEEAFHEDPVLYQDLKEWLAVRELPVLIADGEGLASPRLLEWARDGRIDVVQYDIIGHGITQWLRTGAQLDEWGVKSAPHSYGRPFGNYASPHLSAAVRGFTFVEWDEAEIPGLDASAYRLEEGHVTVPDSPGFGLGLDEERFRHAVGENGGEAHLL